MPVTVEEEIVVLYALYCYDGAASKADATDFILSKGLMQALPGDDELVATGETRIANRIAWARESLKIKQPAQLSMPRHGTWKITDAGKERLFRAAIQSHIYEKDGLAMIDDLRWDRFSPKFLEKLRQLGAARRKFEDRKSETRLNSQDAESDL